MHLLVDTGLKPTEQLRTGGCGLGTAGEWETGVADVAVKIPKKLMNLGVGIDPQMPQLRAPYPLSPLPP